MCVCVCVWGCGVHDAGGGGGAGQRSQTLESWDKVRRRREREGGGEVDDGGNRVEGVERVERAGGRRCAQGRADLAQECLPEDMLQRSDSRLMQ